MTENPSTLPEVFRLFSRKSSPQLMFLLCLVAWGIRLGLGQWRLLDLAIVGFIVVMWPFVEWAIHVFILHFKPKRIGPWNLDFPVAAKHRKHHNDPWRLDLIFIPLRSYILAIPTLVVLWALFFDWPQAFTGIATFVLFALHYEWVHFLVHTRYTPKSWIYKRMWRHHRLHHCKNENYWLGVSTQLGDWVLGTHADPKDVETSPTCRNLGQEVAR